MSVLAFFVLLILVFNDRQPVDLSAKAGEKEAVAKEEPEQQAEQPVPAISDEDYVYGKRDAKVVVIEYTDFECPFCLKHYETAKKIKAAFGDKIAFVGRHFPLSFHENAQKAAEAAECAGEQGKFWEMYDKLFEANEAKAMGVEKWKAEAKSLGLKADKFNNCLDSGKYAGKIQKEAADGAGAGVKGTPATFVNGQLISGAQPYEVFQSAISALLD